MKDEQPVTTYTTITGKQIGEKHYGFLTRMYRHLVPVPKAPRRRSASVSHFRATRRRLAFYRHNA